MTDGRTRLVVGTRVLTDKGAGVVDELTATGWTIRPAFGEPVYVSFSDRALVREIDQGGVGAVTEALRPTWDAIDTAARQVALDRLEVVQEILTGYRDGMAELAREGEPRWPFGPGFGVSEARRCEAMAKVLGEEHRHDRARQRRIRDGELQGGTVGVSTIRRWVKDWKDNGLVALIDGRSVRVRGFFDGLDPRFKAVAESVVDTLDGDISTVARAELRRRIDVQLKIDGAVDIKVPERIAGEYLSSLKRERGATTRAQRSRSLRKTSGTQHFPAIRPGQIIAIDATRADNLVYSPLTGKPYSVEILTAIDVATRVVLALRITPRSATAIDAGLLVYDVCRPFSMQVRGTATSDWRWGGLPELVDASGDPVPAQPQAVLPDFSTLQGFHHIPGVRPDGIHTDQGTIFAGQTFRAILHSLSIDLLLSRGEHPTDNPHVERWHQTIQRGLQQFPGYKGRNTSERGRLVANKPLGTAEELRLYLRRFVALDYHRDHHEGIVLPGEREARICPLEMWDAMLESTGRIDVPQTPDLIYQFLPIQWLTINHQGVEWKNLVYDSPVLGDYRNVPRGYFRDGDRAAPFYVDPHDVSRIWFRDPKTTVVQPVPWRGAARIDAPMTAGIVKAACDRIRARGGNAALRKGSPTSQILDEITELTLAPKLPGDQNKVIAATLRFEQSRADHNEAQHAIRQFLPTTTAKDLATAASRREPALMNARWPNLLAED